MSRGKACYPKKYHGYAGEFRNKGRDGKGKDKKDKQQKSRECPPAFFQNRTINSITNLSCSDSFAKDSLS